jgi:hypothetical protein
MQTSNLLENPGYPNLPNGENDSVRAISRDEAVWMAAILDGEGCIHFSQRSKKENRRVSIKIRIEIGNSCPFLIRKISEIWYKLGLNFCYVWQVSNNQLKRGRQKDYMRIITQSLRGCQKLLQTVRPWLITKAAEADLALEYLEWRITSFPTHINAHNPRIEEIKERTFKLRDDLVKHRAIRFSSQRLPRRSSMPLDLANLVVKDMV